MFFKTVKTLTQNSGADTKKIILQEDVTVANTL